MENEKTSWAAVIATDIIMTAASLLAIFSTIALFAVGGFAAVCSVYGIIKACGAASGTGFAVAAASLAASAVCFICMYFLFFTFVRGAEKHWERRRREVADLKKKGGR